MRTPVIFTIFNRPDITARVFSQIARVKPPRLYILADAPRKRPGEAERCAATQSVVEKVDWDCEVVRDYSTVNEGPKRRLSSGISRVFEREQEAIILEHDCLPDPTFFRFCEELLEKYRGDERVMHISGNDFLFGRVKMMDSYGFSRITLTWGFATWRRAWRHYDVEMKAWPAVRDTSLLPDALLGDTCCLDYFTRVFDRTFAGEIDTWDYQWLLTCWRENGLAIVPQTNLVSNIGFGEGALYCGNIQDRLANVPARPITFPLNHPARVARNVDVDRYLIRRILVPSQRQQMDGWRRILHQLRRRVAIRSRLKRWLAKHP